MLKHLVYVCKKQRYIYICCSYGLIATVLVSLCKWVLCAEYMFCWSHTHQTGSSHASNTIVFERHAIGLPCRYALSSSSSFALVFCVCVSQWSYLPECCTQVRFLPTTKSTTTMATWLLDPLQLQQPAEGTLWNTFIVHIDVSHALFVRHIVAVLKTNTVTLTSHTMMVFSGLVQWQNRAFPRTSEHALTHHHHSHQEQQQQRASPVRVCSARIDHPKNRHEKCVRTLSV